MGASLHARLVSAPRGFLGANDGSLAGKVTMNLRRRGTSDKNVRSPSLWGETERIEGLKQLTMNLNADAAWQIPPYPSQSEHQQKPEPEGSTGILVYQKNTHKKSAFHSWLNLCKAGPRQLPARPQRLGTRSTAKYLGPHPTLPPRVQPQKPCPNSPRRPRGLSRERNPEPRAGLLRPCFPQEPTTVLVGSAPG